MQAFLAVEHQRVVVQGTRHLQRKSGRLVVVIDREELPLAERLLARALFVYVSQRTNEGVLQLKFGWSLRANAHGLLREAALFYSILALAAEPQELEQVGVALLQLLRLHSPIKLYALALKN